MPESEAEKRIRELEIEQARHDERIKSAKEFILRQHGLWVWALTGLAGLAIAGAFAFS